VFVALIYVYIYLMDKLDDKYNLNRDADEAAGQARRESEDIR
jgi:uncharacterized membrane protein